MTDRPDADPVVYGALWCPDCRRSKKLMERLGVAYRWIDLETEPDRIDDVERISGRQSIPLILLPDGRHLSEPSDRELRTALEGAGLVAPS